MNSPNPSMPVLVIFAGGFASYSGSAPQLRVGIRFPDGSDVPHNDARRGLNIIVSGLYLLPEDETPRLWGGGIQVACNHIGSLIDERQAEGIASLLGKIARGRQKLVQELGSEGGPERNDFPNVVARIAKILKIQAAIVEDDVRPIGAFVDHLRGLIAKQQADAEYRLAEANRLAMIARREQSAEAVAA